MAPLKVKGAYVNNGVVNGEHVWKAQYPKHPERPTDMGTRTRTYGTATGITSEAACLHVCQWLWKQHSMRANVPCPWDVTGACA